LFFFLLIELTFDFYCIQSWDLYFRNQNSLSTTKNQSGPISIAETPMLSSHLTTISVNTKTLQEHLAIQALVRAYQVDFICF